jgi:hypothetical protein
VHFSILAARLRLVGSKVGARVQSLGDVLEEPLGFMRSLPGGAHEAGLCGHAGGRGGFFQVRKVVGLGMYFHSRHSHCSGAGGMSVRRLMLLYSINTGSRDAGWLGGCSRHSTRRDRDASWRVGKKIIMGGASRARMSLSQTLLSRKRAFRCRHGLSVPWSVAPLDQRERFALHEDDYQ